MGSHRKGKNRGERIRGLTHQEIERVKRDLVRLCGLRIFFGVQAFVTKRYATARYLRTRFCLGLNEYGLIVNFDSARKGPRIFRWGFAGIADLRFPLHDDRE